MVLINLVGEIVKYMSQNWFTILLISLVTWIIVVKLSRRRLYYLASKFPKLPDQLPIFGYSLQFMRLNPKDCFTYMAHISKEATKNDGVVGLWLGPFFYLMLTDPQDCDTVMRTCLNKPFIYNAIKIWMGDGLLSSNGGKWKSHRRVIQPAFGPKMINNSLNVINKQAISLTNILEKETGKGSFDILPYINVFNMDVVCEAIMGISVNAQEKPNPNVIKALNHHHSLTIKRMFNFLHRPDITFNFREMKFDLARKNSRFTQKIIEQRKQEFLKRKTEDMLKKGETDNKSIGLGDNFLDQMIAACDEHDKWTDQDFRDEVDTIKYTAQGTTALTIGYALLALAACPKVQDKVVSELRDVFGDSRRPVEKEDLLKLEYLERVIKETLRFFQLVPIIARNSQEEVKIRNYTIPKNTTILISLWEMQRRKDLWGQNADEFNPDNFLPDVQANRHTFAFAPFSSGPRICIGLSFAMVTIKATLATILRTYKLSTEMDLMNLEYVFSITLRSEKGILIKLKHRS